MYIAVYCYTLLQATAGLLFYVLRAQPRKIFHKLNVHAGAIYCSTHACTSLQPCILAYSVKILVYTGYRNL